MQKNSVELLESTLGTNSWTASFSVIEEISQVDGGKTTPP